MSPPKFREQIALLTAQLANRPLDAALDAWLNAEHGAGSATYEQLKKTCIAGAAEGWLCEREGGGEQDLAGAIRDRDPGRDRPRQRDVRPPGRGRRRPGPAGPAAGPPRRWAGR